MNNYSPLLHGVCDSAHRVKVSTDGMESLVTLSQGDMRRALNILQSTSMSHDEVTEETVYLVTGQPLPNDIAKIVEWMLNENYTTAYQSKHSIFVIPSSMAVLAQATDMLMTLNGCFWLFFEMAHWLSIANRLFILHALLLANLYLLLLHICGMASWVLISRAVLCRRVETENSQGTGFRRHTSTSSHIRTQK